MPKYPMTEVIAEREYTLLTDGLDEVIRAQVGKPARTPDTPHTTWYCPWSVQRGGKTSQLSAVGEDSLQALLLGLSGLRTDLDLISSKGKLTSLGGIEGPFLHLTGQ